jgi:deoxyribodipyrimidine photolyase
MSSTAILWLRHDLRVHDHPALRAALEQADVRRYVPELHDVPDEYVREPWKMPGEVQQQAGCLIGADYPKPIVDHFAARKRALERYALD